MLGRQHAEKKATRIAVDGANLFIIHRFPIVEADHGLAQLDRVINRCQAEATARINGALLALLKSRAEGLQFGHCASQLNRNRVGQRTVDDINNTIVVLCQVIQKDRVGDQALVVCHASSLDGDVLQEVLLIGQVDQPEALLNDTLDSSAIIANIAQQLGKVSGLQDELTEGFVAHRRLRLAKRTSEVCIKADQSKIINCSFNVPGSEFSRVLGDEVSEVDLGVLLDRERHCTQDH
jgi:hypothetical protein